MRLFLFTMLLLPVSLMAQTTYKLGLKFDDDSYEQVPLKSKLVTKDRGDLPARADLTQYVPSIGDQGQEGTCVGFATAYYVRSILENKQRGRTNQNEKDKQVYSPAFTYNVIKDPQDTQCQGGAKIDTALEYFKQKGAARLTDIPYPACNISTDRTLPADSKIAGYSRLFDISDPTDVKIDGTKKALAEGNPVAIGMRVPGSLSKPNPETGLWEPDRTEEVRGGHALCVVGYDNDKFGGAFLIVNSWGAGYGKKGYFWAKYDDYAYYVKYGYEPFPLANDNPQPSDTTLSANLEFQLTTGGQYR